jgi:microcystin-dependent protein
MDKFANTKFVLAAYDNFMEHGWNVKGVWGTLFAIDERERLGRLVGRTFGNDTKDINSPETCEECVRPGEWLRKTISV